MQQHPDVPQTHFHILWNDQDHLDWECFDTIAGASKRAGELARPNEVFTIQAVSADCSLRRAKSMSAGKNSFVDFA